MLKIQLRFQSKCSLFLWERYRKWYHRTSSRQFCQMNCIFSFSQCPGADVHICKHIYIHAHMHTQSHMWTPPYTGFFLTWCSAFLLASGQIICFPCICVLFGQLAEDTDAESGQLPSAKSIRMSLTALPSLGHVLVSLLSRNHRVDA